MDESDASSIPDIIIDEYSMEPPHVEANSEKMRSERKTASECVRHAVRTCSMLFVRFEHVPIVRSIFVEVVYRSNQKMAARQKNKDISLFYHISR